MATEDDQGDGKVRAGVGTLRVIAGIVLIPFLWIGVAVNFLGLAEKFSSLPGISPDGGVKSGIVALLLTVLMLGVVAAGVSVAMDVGITPMGGGDHGAAQQTPTPTATRTPTATPMPTPAATTTATPTKSPADLKSFKVDFRSRIKELNQNETLTDVPVAAIEYRQAEDGAAELWIVYRECDYAEDARVQRYNIAVNYANSVGLVDGDKPDRLRAYGVTRHKNFSSNFMTISTSLADSWYEYDINSSTYVDNYRQRLRGPYEDEEDIAYRMTVDEIGEAKAYKLFTDHYSVNERGETRCPGIGEAPG